MNVKEIFAPYEMDGRSSMILTGRPIYDLECGEDGSISTLVKLMADRAKDKGMVVVRYILAHGITINYKMYGKADSSTIKNALSTFGITNAPAGGCDSKASQELVDILRGISKLASSSDADFKWQNGEKMKFLFLFEFSSDIMPNASTVNQLVARELVYELVNSKRFLDNGNLIILSDVVEDKIDCQIRSQVYHKFLPYPGYEEKLTFVKALHKKYPKASYAKGLDDQFIANLSSSIPNRGLDLLFRASHVSGQPIEAKVLIDQKSKDVEAISEGTISMLDTRRVKDTELKGRNVRVPMEFLMEQGEGLRSRNKSTFPNIILSGAPGTGKTELAYLTAQRAMVPIYQLNSAKAGIVGETERRATLQTRIFANMTPSLGFVDEITEAMPMERSHNLDSGASDAVMQAFLNMLSDNRREGRSMLIATTNCGYKMGSAMRDRFVIIPVIMPSIEDFPEIICSIAKQVSGVTIDPQDPAIKEAAKVFYDKHCMPRRIRATLKFVSGYGELTPEAIREAAKDASPLDETSWLSAVYADLSAISLAASSCLLPWYGQEDTYPFPDYIRAILDENHKVDTTKLSRELKRLEPFVNV